jgi:arylsulfatase
VLLAHGDRFSGYVLFVASGHLIHDYNRAGEHTVLRSTRPIPEGATVLGYEFRRTDRLAGVASLSIDGVAAGRGVLTGTLGVHLNAVGIDVGNDRHGPVSPSYESPFPFAGGLLRVVIDVGDDAAAIDSDWVAD